MNQDKTNCSAKNNLPGTLKLGGVLTIGSKGQIVIPKEVRDALYLSPGSDVAIFYSVDKQHIGLVKNDDLQKIIDFARSEGIHIEY
ncbi:MAG: AbrB/MazE/SpoVT family DNA-binding domain-containing protein [Candidatus Altimarinota bacterium]